MKAILIIDIPDKYKFSDFQEVITDLWFKGKNSFIRNYSYMHRGVELRPLPEKQKLIVTGKNQIEKKKAIEGKSLEQIKKGYINNPEVAFYCGYNACIDELLGDTE